MTFSVATGVAIAADKEHGDAQGENGDGHGDSSHHAIPHHHLAVFLGYALERKREKDEEAGVIGIAYEYRFAEKWGVGGVIEGLGHDTVRDVSVVLPVSFHPGGGFKLLAGPGREYSSKHDYWMFRIGGGYEFEMGNRWTLAPEMVYDMIESGKRTYILGVALGRSF